MTFNSAAAAARAPDMLKLSVWRVLPTNHSYYCSVLCLPLIENTLLVENGGHKPHTWLQYSYLVLVAAAELKVLVLINPSITHVAA